MKIAISIEKNKRKLVLTKIIFTPEFTGFVSKRGEKSKFVGRDLQISYSDPLLVDLMDEFPDSELDDQLKVMYEEIKQMQADQAENAKNINANIVDLPYEYQFKRAPMPHQIKALALSYNKKNYALLLQQGTGKTKIILDNAAYLWQTGEIDCLVIVAWPNGLQNNWIDYELPLDLPDWTKYLGVAWNSGKRNTQEFKELFAKFKKHEGLKVIAFNVESASSAISQKIILEVLKENRCMLVLDQSAAIKNPHSIRAEFFLKCAPLAKYRRILDGSPNAEGVEELYTQFEFLDKRIIGCENFYQFRAIYCTLGYHKNIIGYKNLDKLYEKIFGHSFRVLSDDVLQLPAKQYKTIPFELNADERRIYDELKKLNLASFLKVKELALSDADGEFDQEDQQMADAKLVAVNNKFLEISLAITKLLRLQQISSGWFFDEQSTGTLPINTGKSSRLEALENLVNSIDGKILIFSKFTKDIEEILKLFPNSVGYYGALKPDERVVNKDKFLTDPNTRIMVGQPRALGIGHTLTVARNLIFYTNDHSLRMREECEKRVHRSGLEKTIPYGERLLIYDLVAKNTIDSKILQAFVQKKIISDMILRDPDQFFLVGDDE